MQLTRFNLRRRGVKIFLLLFVLAAAVFANHIFLVEAALEHIILAETVFDYGVIHPQESLDKTLSINLSAASLADGNVGIVNYEIDPQKKCKVLGAGGACVEYEPSLCPYLSLTTTNVANTGFTSPNEAEPYPVAYGGIYKTFGQLGDNWTLHLTAPCFEGECRQDYDAAKFGTPLPQSLKGRTFACDLGVRVTGVSGGIFQVRRWENFLFPIAYAFEEAVVPVTATFGEAAPTGNSSVAFLPGLEASRLYKPGMFFENQLWEPNRNDDVRKLYLNSDGTPQDSGIYVRGDIDQIYGLFNNIYAGFHDSMQKLVDDKVIREFEVLPYDWRLNRILPRREYHLNNPG